MSLSPESSNEVTAAHYRPVFFGESFVHSDVKKVFVIDIGVSFNT